MNTTTFSISAIQTLRKRAAKRAQPAEDCPEGWSKSSVDPMRVLAVFTPLRIKDGYILRAYQFREGGNGNGVVWAMPLEADFPEPEDCPRLEDEFLEPPKPPAALDEVMEAIDGDGSPWSYLCASLLSRELGEFGAMWHGCQWSTHTILGKNPWKARGHTEGSAHVPSTDPAKWTWHEPEPADWKPQVVQERTKVTVTFMTFSGFDQETIFRHQDAFRKGSYCFKTCRKDIAAGTGGYAF